MSYYEHYYAAGNFPTVGYAGEEAKKGSNLIYIYLFDKKQIPRSKQI